MRISTSRKSVIVGERPLNPAERGAMVFAAATTTLLFYVATIVAAALLLVVAIILLAAVLGAARVGLAGTIAPALKREWGLLVIIFKSLWLRSGAEFRLKVTGADAPRLFAMVTRLAGKFEVQAPQEVLIEMNCGAWVELKGLRRGRGRTTLGIGYDLLAGLPEHEVEAVLAHEMAHAKFLNRGLSAWIRKALHRLATMTGELSAYTSAHRHAKNRTAIGELLYRIYDSLTTRSARLVATYSRQDEFEADAGAAEACGPAYIRWALIHLERLSADLDRLPWNERVARLESETSFSRWLTGALAQESVKPRDQMRDAVDPYSTHPSLRDRVAALNADNSVAIPGRPGIELLENPDKVASQLVLEIQRTILREERRDTRELRKQVRKLQKPTETAAMQWVGLVFVVGAVVFLIASLDAPTPATLIGVLTLAGVGGVLLQRGRFRDRRTLAIPQFGTLTWKKIPPAEMESIETQIEQELRRAHGSVGSKPDAEPYVDICFAALAERDYLRAHVAGRLALEIAKSHKEAALGLGIAAAGIGNGPQSDELLEWVRSHAGWRTPNTMWGVAWAKSLLDQWPVCEALLTELVEKNPGQPTYQSLLALALHCRGKARSAEAHSRKAMAVEPTNTDHAELLAQIYLQSGRVRDAAATLSRLREVAEKDADVAHLFVRMELLRQNPDEALRWAGVTVSIDPDPLWLIRFGFMFENARHDDHAAAFFTRALEAGHFPEAHIGLARLRTTSGEAEVARQHLLNALNAERELAPAAQSPFALFHDIIGQINMLEDRRVSCKAWIATIPQGEFGELGGTNVFVCAPEQKGAAAHLQRIVASVYPSAPFVATNLVWKEAPEDQQPVRPIAPGVQRVMAQ